MKQLDALDSWIEEEMKKRGFLVHPRKLGHWRSASHAGHTQEFEFRHRTIRKWVEALWMADDYVGARAKLDGEVTAVVNGKREGDNAYPKPEVAPVCATCGAPRPIPPRSTEYAGPPIGTEKL